MKYRVIVWTKNGDIVVSILHDTDEKRKDIIKEYAPTSRDDTLAIYISDYRVDLIPGNEIRKIRVKFYKENTDECQ